MFQASNIQHLCRSDSVIPVCMHVQPEAAARRRGSCCRITRRHVLVRSRHATTSRSSSAGVARRWPCPTRCCSRRRTSCRVETSATSFYACSRYTAPAQRAENALNILTLPCYSPCAASLAGILPGDLGLSGLVHEKAHPNTSNSI